MGKHTPGPWYATNAGNDHQGLILDEKTGANVAVSYDKCHAALIAAAPALYEALRAVLDETAAYHRWSVECRQWLIDAKNALAQAEGSAK